MNIDVDIHRLLLIRALAQYIKQEPLLIVIVNANDMICTLSQGCEDIKC